MHVTFDLQKLWNFVARENFADYFLSNYIGDVAKALFPIELWNLYEIDERTNNPVEAYNHTLNNTIGPHRNIWAFIKKIKGEEASTALNYVRLESDTFFKRGRNFDFDKDLKISRAKVNYLTKKTLQIETKKNVP